MNVICIVSKMEMLLLFRVYHIEHIHRFTDCKKMCPFRDLQWYTLQGRAMFCSSETKNIQLSLPDRFMKF